MLKFYHITDQLSSRGGYKASKENIKLYKVLFKGKVIDIQSIKKNLFKNFKFTIYKLINFLFKNYLFKANNKSVVTLPQYFDLLKVGKRHNKVFFIHYTNMIFNYDIIEKYQNSKFIVFLYDEWPLEGIYHFNYNVKTGIISDYLIKLIKKKKLDLLSKKNVIVLASTNYLKKKYLKLTNNNNVFQIYYPVDNKFWINKNFHDANKNIFLDEKYDYVLFTARGGTLNYRKGGDLLIKILKKFKNRKKIKFLILGQYETEFIKENFNNVEFINLHTDEDLRNLYSCIKLNLTLSRFENLPYSIIESMACKVPNIAFNTGGINEIIKHKYNGWIAKKNNINSICSGIEWSLKNHSKLKNISRKSIIEKLSYNKTKPKIKKLKKFYLQ